MTAPQRMSGFETERLEIVRSTERLDAVGPAWTDLWRRAGGLVFQSHAWVAAWWATVPDRRRRRLHVVLCWHGETLLAVLPLATCRRRGFRLLEWAAKDYTDYGDVLAAPDCEPAALRRMWDRVSSAGGFDLIYLNRLLPDARARALLDPATARSIRLRPNHRRDASLRVANVWPSGEAWFGAQSKKTRQNYRRGQKVMAERGALRFRLLPADEPLGPVLERLCALKRKCLAGQALRSALFDHGAPALSALVQVLADTGVLRLFVLECDGVMVAVSVNFVQAGSMMAFVTTYDPDVERGSPGMVLMMDYIRWSIDRGLHTIDFLCGAEPFKTRFATRSVTLGSVVGTRTLAGAAAMMVDRCHHGLQTLGLGVVGPRHDEPQAKAEAVR